ncbi:MAG: acetyl-CoA carboxylase carboxyltransferase subunit alpha [Fimbriimonas sp.]|nr:acetyl-CoA carboxylase carboxyltransferase subunit alpha [Fimbriimonas sp.]
MYKTHKEWERPLYELEDGIAKLKEIAKKEKDPQKREQQMAKIAEYETRRNRYVEVMYSNLGAWEKVLVARAERRPYTLDYIQAVFHHFIELQGDRNGFVDHAIVGGPAMLDNRPVMVVGHQKGRTIQERQLRNFGYARPEGYRKAIRLFEMAERFRMPVITLIDTPGADAGVEAEARGISEAIAASIFKMFELTVPSISVIIGEGGSGGAIGIAASNRVLMLEHSIYSVIAPEGCASILWRQAERAPDAAKALKLTAQSALEFELIDEIIPEPTGGSDKDWPATFGHVKSAIVKHIGLLDKFSPEEVYEDRYARFRKMGIFEDLLND